MKTLRRSQHLHWCVSVNSDTGVFVYVSACEGRYCIPVLRSGSRVGHPNGDKVKENVCGWHLLGGGGHAGSGEALHT